MSCTDKPRFQTYFPHVDNVYSHRSTQRYKRKPFVSHYWDCRLKGRPPGTPKSDDPNKKKRKRTARERDLCDVKIKITEYFPGAMLRPDFVPDGPQGPDGSSPGGNFFSPNQPVPLAAQQQAFGMLATNNGIPSNHPGSTGQRYYTIQRVNGNGGNGKGDGVAGPHKHTLEMSDKVKKNTVQRFLAKRDKEEKKTQVSSPILSYSYSLLLPFISMVMACPNLDFRWMGAIVVVVAKPSPTYHTLSSHDRCVDGSISSFHIPTPL
jgi:glutathione S-transferase